MLDFLLGLNIPFVFCLGISILIFISLRLNNQTLSNLIVKFDFSDKIFLTIPHFDKSLGVSCNNQTCFRVHINRKDIYIMFVAAFKWNIV